MPCSNLRFLVVEDHEFQRRTLVHLLTTLGAETVHAADDGQSALDVIRDPDRPVDVVLSDLVMPGMDGMEFIRHLSDTGAGASLILASAVDSELLASVGKMAQAYQVRLLGAIEKPATAVKLTPLIERHRSAQAEPPGDAARFPLEEIAEAWTHGEFEPWFEPRIDLATGAVRGFSAVPRWRHPLKGLLEPEAFMASIEARGLNDDFAWLMLQKSAAQCRRWVGKGHDLVVSVSLSFSSLRDANLASRVQQTAQKEGLDPRHMILGVRESALGKDLARTLENLARLRIAGFGLAIDDFGSGAMSVEQLSLVAFTELRLMSSFVRGADCDDSARAGLAVGLELANQLKLQPVAGGIGSKQEWNLLYEWGCVLGQGPFISEPLRADAVAGWLARWRIQRS